MVVPIILPTTVEMSPSGNNLLLSAQQNKKPARRFIRWTKSLASPHMPILPSRSCLALIDIQNEK